MQHLDSERLAQAADDALSAADLQHLATCVPCRRERDAYLALAQLAVDERDAWMSAPPAPPLARWDVLREQLAGEGLLQTPSAAAVDGGADIVPIAAHTSRAVAPMVGAAPIGRRARALPAWARVAAAAAVFVAGTVVGGTFGGPIILPIGGNVPAAPSSLGGAAQLATNGIGPANGPRFASVDEATRVLAAAQRDYEQAAMWLAEHDTTITAQSVYRARLAALDRMMAASRAALYEAPQDPMLNQYYLAASTAREATLRQLGDALPVDRVMQSF